MAKPRLADGVVGEIVAAIVSGEFRPGSMLPPEAELAERTGVSRLTVREAITVLQAKHVLEVRHGRGTVVNPIARWTPFDPMLLAARSRHADGAGALPEKLIEARRLIEVGVAELAAARRSEADLGALAATLDRMEAAGADVDAFAAADIEFHQAVLAAAGNAFLAAIFDPFGQLIWAARRQTKVHAEIRAHALVAHRRIFGAIRERDPEAARWAMHQHMMQTKEDLEGHAEKLELEEAYAAAGANGAPLAASLGLTPVPAGVGPGKRP